jgi:hypothetical protein
MTSGRLSLCFVAVALAAALTQVRAAPLDADTCEKVKVEHGQLEQAGIEQDLAKGAAWGKANLAADRLAQVRRFIELEEQLLFRCRNKTLVHLPPEPEAAPGADADKQDKDKDKDGADAKPGTPAPGTAKTKGPQPKADTKQKAGSKQKDKDKAKKKPAAQSKEPKKQDSGTAKKGSPQAESAPPQTTTIAKTPPKAKVDDAYKAPPPEPSVNPFATQLKKLNKE